MDVEHPIDAEIREWLKRHVDNEKELSVAAGHSTSWLHKYVNGSGHATIDDLVRIAGLLFGLNLPAIRETERRLLKAVRGLDEHNLQDVLSYAELRAKRRAPHPPSTESSAPAVHTPPATTRTGRGTRKVGKG